MKLSVRLNPEASQYFQKRMDEWHLNQTETLHKLIIEHKSNQEEIRVLKHDLDVMRQLINERPTQSQAEKKRTDHITKAETPMRQRRELPNRPERILLSNVQQKSP